MTRDGLNYVFEFIVNMYKDQTPRKVRINVPLEDVSAKTEKGREQEKNALMRILYYSLKNRFVTVTNGLKEFEQEFLDDLVIMVDGKEQRVGDVIAPAYKQMLSENRTPVFHITSGK